MMAEGPSILGKVETPPTMQDIAFQSIKQAIMGQHLIPGEIYSELAVAKEMGMSKTPVHQALLDLENKGFVTIMPRKGFRVNSLTAKNISDMFELRRALERAIILRVTPKLTAVMVDDLREMVGRIEKTQDPFEFQKHDRAFHRYLASLSNNNYIINSLNTVWDLSDWVGAKVLSDLGRYDQAAQEHLVVFEFLSQGQAEKAAAAMERHINGTEKRFLERLPGKD
jgi:DNA-binding GntR family transcriptional regulator